MNRRVRNVVLFVGALLGAALLMLGIRGIAANEPNAWLYVLGAIFAFALAWLPGRRLRDINR